MALISGCLESFSFKNMTQVPTTSCTCYLNSPPIWIRLKKFAFLWLRYIPKRNNNKLSARICNQHSLSDLWHQGDPQRTQASHNQNQIWYQTCKGEFHIQHNCKFLLHKTCYILPCPSVCKYYQWKHSTVSHNQNSFKASMSHGLRCLSKSSIR